MPVYIQNDDNLIETLGSRIKFFREYAGMFQGDFADSLMVSQKEHHFGVCCDGENDFCVFDKYRIL